jgi:hypothetical protein
VTPEVRYSENPPSTKALAARLIAEDEVGAIVSNVEPSAIDARIGRQGEHWHTRRSNLQGRSSCFLLVVQGKFGCSAITCSEADSRAQSLVSVVKDEP